MKQNRSIYTYTVTSPTAAEEIIQSWLTAYKFKLMTKGGEQLYRSGDGFLTAFRCFQYTLAGNQLTLSAWVKGTVGGETPLESQFVGVLATAPYRDDLAQLFEALTPLLAQSAAPAQSPTSPSTPTADLNPNSSTINSQGTTMPTNNFQNFESQANHRDETLTTIAFVLSIIGFIAALFTDVTYGLLVYVMIYAFAARGLKTAKKSLALASIVLTSLSLAITIIKIIIIAAE